MSSWSLAAAIQGAFWAAHLLEARQFLNTSKKSKKTRIDRLNDLAVSLRHARQDLLAKAPEGAWEDPDFAGLLAGIESALIGQLGIRATGRFRDPEQPQYFIEQEFAAEAFPKIKAHRIFAVVLFEWGLADSYIAALIKSLGISNSGYPQILANIQPARNRHDWLFYAMELVTKSQFRRPPEPRSFVGRLDPDFGARRLRGTLVRTAQELAGKTNLAWETQNEKGEPKFDVEASGDSALWWTARAFWSAVHRDVCLGDFHRVDAAATTVTSQIGVDGFSYNTDVIGEAVARRLLQSVGDGTRSELPTGLALLELVRSEYGEQVAWLVALGVMHTCKPVVPTFIFPDARSVLKISVQT